MYSYLAYTSQRITTKVEPLQRSKKAKASDRLTVVTSVLQITYSLWNCRYNIFFCFLQLPSVAYDGLDNDVIVIKSEDISDNEQSSHNGVGGMDDMDDDDDDCLSTKDIPEVCLEEEDDEIFATDLRQTTTVPGAQQQAQTLQQQLQAVQQQQRQTPPQPEITIQNVGGIRVGSIGNIASLTSAAKALQNATSNNNNNSSTNNINSSGNSNGNTAAAEQQQREQQQQLLFDGLGLSAG